MSNELENIDNEKKKKKKKKKKCHTNKRIWQKIEKAIR